MRLAQGDAASLRHRRCGDTGQRSGDIERDILSADPDGAVAVGVGEQRGLRDVELGVVPPAVRACHEEPAVAEDRPPLYLLGRTDHAGGIGFGRPVGAEAVSERPGVVVPVVVSGDGIAAVAL